MTTLNEILKVQGWTEENREQLKHLYRQSPLVWSLCMELVNMHEQNVAEKQRHAAMMEQHGEYHVSAIQKMRYP